MKDTLKFGQERGWKQIIFGHVGREPEKSLAKVAARLGEILGCKVTFIEDWLDPATTTIKDDAAKTIAQSPPGSVIMLQNTRKYDIERVLWKAKPADIDKLAEKLAKLANEFAAEGGEGLRSRGVFGRQPRRLERGRARRDGKGGPGQVRGRAVRRPPEGMPRTPRWSSSAA